MSTIESKGVRGITKVPGADEDQTESRSTSRSRRVSGTIVSAPSSMTDSNLLSEDDKKKRAEDKKKRWYHRISEKIVDNTFFVWVTTLLTLYALTGSDIRMLCTDKPADSYFDIAVLVCLVVFCFEILVSTLGKADYWLGFFFTLDILSTTTLVLDLTFVSVSDLLGGSEGDVRSSRTARVGAKAARIIRVIRLVRILKLYKAYYEKRQQRLRRQREAAEGKAPGDDDWADEEEKEEEGMSSQESTLGKKLSEVTTRKVIILVLAMLMMLPLVQAEAESQLPYAVEYGADVVQNAFERYLNSNLQTSERDRYRQSYLTYAYYHNWWAMKDPKTYCPYDQQTCGGNIYLGFFFFGGIRGNNRESMANLTKLDTTAVEFNARAKEDPMAFYNLGYMPEQAVDALSGSWDLSCDSGTKGFSLISSSDLVGYPVSCPEDLRLDEVQCFFPSQQTATSSANWQLVFCYDIRLSTRAEAIYGLLTTFFIMFLLLAGSMQFSNDANRLVVHPVENMIKRVRAIRDNPLIAVKMADEEFKQEEIRRAKMRRKTTGCMAIAQNLLFDFLSCKCCSQKSQEPMETVILEKTIIKLGSLLALGFGEAGANIISSNMRGSDSSGVNAMVPGVLVDCIIGVCKVQDFSTATEVLQAKIMTFVNQIAEIIHGVVDEFHGSPNKNSGESFLIIWRVDANDAEDKHRRMAEMSIVAFAKILGGMHRSSLLADYRTHPGLQYRLGKNARMTLSFGLHAGWAIEGAVGSEFKIDASYVSPNVSIAASVERYTQVYNVSLVAADSVLRLCNAELASKCRKIDRVIITGSAAPMGLYCIDLDWASLEVDDSPPPEVVWNTKNRYRARQWIEGQKNSKWGEEVSMARAFDEDPVISVMRQRYTTQFFQLFNMGYQNYFQGEWQVARRMLSETRSILGAEDGPSTALLRYMEYPHQFEAPKDWHGVREMTLAGSVGT
eukprot:TRINITY_DN3973_c0_g4_i1.p1 TRINITY_DN3973_c0_g4~~TRINITY_DN3973_c0_g4_i1.p1  ORF type:complete len:955 (-),score=143.37 TRINITY_DN3973_c0_g4_i1:54-2918(-)